MSFFNQTHNYFDFLIKLGYKELLVSDNVIQYNNETIIIEIQYNAYSYEIETYFSLVDSTEKISLSDLLNYLGIEKMGIYQLSNNDKVDLGLKYISDLIKQVLAIIDDRNYEIIKKAFSFTENGRKNKLLEIGRKSEFDKAEKYWKNKDYDEVERIYSKYLDDLPDLYKYRLNYIYNKNANDNSLCFPKKHDPIYK